MHVQTEAVVDACKHFASWLLGARNDPLVFVASTDMMTAIFGDSSHGNDRLTSRGYIGRLLQVGKNSISFRTTLPRTVSLSSRDGELQAAIHAAKSIIAFGMLLRDLGIHPGGPLPVYSDSSATVGSVNSDFIHKESRWNGIRLQWLRQQVRDRLISVLWCSGEAMKADVLTKFCSNLTKFMEIRFELMNLCHRFTKNYGIDSSMGGYNAT